VIKGSLHVDLPHPSLRRYLEKGISSASTICRQTLQILTLSWSVIWGKNIFYAWVHVLKWECLKVKAGERAKRLLARWRGEQRVTFLHGKASKLVFCSQYICAMCIWTCFYPFLKQFSNQVYPRNFKTWPQAEKSDKGIRLIGSDKEKENHLNPAYPLDLFLAGSLNVWPQLCSKFKIADPGKR